MQSFFPPELSLNIKKLKTVEKLVRLQEKLQKLKFYTASSQIFL